MKKKRVTMNANHFFAIVSSMFCPTRFLRMPS